MAPHLLSVPLSRLLRCRPLLRAPTAVSEEEGGILEVQHF